MSLKKHDVCVIKETECVSLKKQNVCVIKETWSVCVIKETGLRMKETASSWSLYPSLKVQMLSRACPRSLSWNLKKNFLPWVLRVETVSNLEPSGTKIFLKVVQFLMKHRVLKFETHGSLIRQARRGQKYGVWWHLDLHCKPCTFRPTIRRINLAYICRVCVWEKNWKIYFRSLITLQWKKFFFRILTFTMYGPCARIVTELSCY